MPTYEYACSHCSHHFEVSQRITDAPLDRCPKCRHKLRRLIGSGSGIIFKGSGFYATDYRKKTDSPTVTAPGPKAGSCPANKEGCNACNQK